MKIRILGFRVSGFGFEINGVGCLGLQAVGFRPSSCGRRVWGFRLWASGFAFRAAGFVFWVSGCGLRVSGFELWASGFGFLVLYHPGVELKANLKSISHRCHLEEVAFEWELTKETIHLPLGCLQGGPGYRKAHLGMPPGLLPPPYHPRHRPTVGSWGRGGFL